MPSRPWSIEELASGNARGLPDGDTLFNDHIQPRSRAATDDRPAVDRLGEHAASQADVARQSGAQPTHRRSLLRTIKGWLR